MGRLPPAFVALASRSLWTGSFWLHDRKEAVARIHKLGSQHASEWMVLATIIGIRHWPELGSDSLIDSLGHLSQDQSLTGFGATQPLSSVFPGKGATSSLQRVLATWSMIDRQALSFAENYEVSCVSRAFPARANCASKGEVWRGLFKGMMLPAVCSDASQPGSSLSQ